MSEHSYKGFISTLSQEFDHQIESIRAEHNFENGSEFEVALCEILEKVLPKKFGVCRGYLTDQSGNVAGDDIIIFDQARFPTLALRKKGGFDRKEYIPIEAAYSYIEAKFTINIEGDDGQSLTKALNQVQAAKELVSSREVVGPNYIDAYHDIKGALANIPDGLPSIRNPFYTSVISCNVRKKKGGEHLIDPKEISSAVVGKALPHRFGPDFVSIGKSVMGLPTVGLGDGRFEVYSPFYLPGKNNLCLVPLKTGISHAIFLTNLLSALDFILLGKMPWQDILQKALDLDYQG
jgi:hypothetical protein